MVIHIIHKVNYDYVESLELIGASTNRDKCIDIINALIQKASHTQTYRINAIDDETQKIIKIDEYHHSGEQGTKPFWREPCITESESRKNRSPKQ